MKVRDASPPFCRISPGKACVPTTHLASLHPRKTVALLMLVVAMGHFNRVGISVAGAERIIPAYGVSAAQMGMVYSAFLLFYTLAMLPGGWVIDRFGPRAALAMLGFGSMVFVALTGGVGFIAHGASSVWLGLLIVRSTLGVTNAPLHPASARMVYEHLPPHSRAFANGLVTFAACVGMAATYYVLGAIIDRFDWQAAFLFSSGLTLIVAVVWTLGTRSSRESSAHRRELTHAHPVLSEMWLVLRRPSVICITLSYAALGYFQYLFFYWIEYYFEQIQHQDRSVARGYSTMITLAMGVGMISGGWLADRVPHSITPRLRRALVPVIGMIASGIVFELGLLGPNPRSTLAAFAVAAALIGACEGSFWTIVVELGRRFGGTTAALMNTGGNAGGTLSPYLTPLLSGYFASRFGSDLGWRFGLAVAGAIVVAGALLWLGIDPASAEEPELGRGDA